MTWRHHVSDRPTDYPVVFEEETFVPQSNRFNRSFPLDETGQPVDIAHSLNNLTSVDGRDGRRIITINGEFPGPVIRVRQGATVKITVYNDMPYQVKIKLQF